MSDCTNLGLPVMRRTSPIKSYLARIPLSLANQGSDSETLGLTYAIRTLSAAMAWLLDVTRTITAIEKNQMGNRFMSLILHSHRILSAIMTAHSTVRFSGVCTAAPILTKVGVDCKTK